MEPGLGGGGGLCQAAERFQCCRDRYPDTPVTSASAWFAGTLPCASDRCRAPSRPAGARCRPGTQMMRPPYRARRMPTGQEREPGSLPDEKLPAERPPDLASPSADPGAGGRAIVTLSGVRHPIVAILLLISFFTGISGKPIDGLLLLTVAAGLAWDGEDPPADDADAPASGGRAAAVIRPAGAQPECATASRRRPSWPPGLPAPCFMRPSWDRSPVFRGPPRSQ